MRLGYFTLFLFFLANCTSPYTDTERLVISDSIATFLRTDSGKLKRTIGAINGSCIVHYVNVSCASCFFDIEQIMKKELELKNLKISTVFVCYSKDDFKYFKYLVESGELNIGNALLLLDSSDRFIRDNKQVKKYEKTPTFLIDNSNSIIGRFDFSSDKNVLENIEKILSK
ncbi:MAG: hypothetical protein EAZ47_10970 [Bacteroidetes bacterium]|nr:MAG: hypothetical protein EAY72_05365 [Bacteroidota bacterium]TAE72105.1 MAG: hypothetical protein EAY68_01460 [Bacteroidota bacterium]TAF90610.1 MAG: hypothetical protein EAZ47_10970 [Bacteroidota bacterium]